MIDVLCVPFVRSTEELIPAIEFYQNGPFTAFIYWPKNRLSGYYLERSSDNGRHWEVLNTSPIFGYTPDEGTYEGLGQDVAMLLEDNVGYIDSLKLGVKYVYRVTTSVSPLQ